MLRSLRRIALMLCALAAVPTQVRAQENAPVKTAFDTDTRLDRHVTLNETGVPLDRLFATLSSGDLELRADPRCAPQRLQIALHDRALRTVMRSIAEMMPGYWTPNSQGNGYRFSLTDKALALRDEWWTLYEGQRAAALEAQRRYIVEKLEEIPKPIHGRNMSPWQLAEITNAATFYTGLPHDLKAAVATQMIDTTLYGIAGAFLTDGSMQEGAAAVRLSDMPPACRQAFRSAQHRLFDLNPLQDTDIGLNIANAGLSLTMSCTLPDGKEGETGIGFHAGFAPNAAPLWLSQQQLVAAVQKGGENVPPEWKRLAAFQEGRLWPNDLPKASSAPHWLFIFGPPRMEQCLDWLKEKSQFEFVSDYYDRSSTMLDERGKAALSGDSLKAALDNLAVQQDVSWKTREGGIYLVRNNRWYRDDRLQVSSDSLALWRAQLSAYIPPVHFGMLPTEPADMKARMDLEAKIVTELSPYQIAIGLRWYAVQSRTEEGRPQTLLPFGGFADRILAERYTALFYASLNEADRLALIAGHLSFSKLNDAQRRQAIFVKPSLGGHPPDHPIFLRLNDMPARPMTLTIPGADRVRGVRLEVVASAAKPIHL